MPREMENAEFLLLCSEASLGDIELARENRVSNMRKQIKVIEAEIADLEAEAAIARWMRAHRRALLSAMSMLRLQECFDFKSCAEVHPRLAVLNVREHGFTDSNPSSEIAKR